MSSDRDVLLYIVSARAQLCWLAFKEAYACLAPSARGSEEQLSLKRASWTLRALESLGHCDSEFSNDGQWIYAAPPVLIKLPISGLRQAVLAGARYTDTCDSLEKACKMLGCGISVHYMPQTSDLPLSPCRVLIEAETPEQIDMLARRMQMHTTSIPPAWLLLHLAPSLEGYLNSRRWSNEPELNWHREEFNTKMLRFTSSNEQSDHTRLARYIDPSRSTHKHYLWRGQVRAEVDPDWGRYVSLRDSGIHVLAYDRHQHQLAVPAGAPLPCFLERAAALCSGFTGVFTKNSVRVSNGVIAPRGYILFGGVPPRYASIIAAKVGQRLLNCNSVFEPAGDAK